MAGHVRRLSNGKWQARWYEPSGRERTKSFPRKADASKHLTYVNNSVLTGTYVDVAAGRVTVAGVAEQWFAGKVNTKATTRARIRSLLDVHVLPAWGAISIVKIEHSAVQRWVAELAASGLSPASIKKTHGVLSGILALAVSDRRLTSNPCKGVNLPRVTSTRRKYLSAPQVAALAAAAGTPTGRSRGARTADTFAQNGLIIYLLAYTGLRWGEMAALRVSSVDLLRKRVVITESVSDVDGEGLVWTTPKDHETRAVAVPGFLVDVLAQHLAGKVQDALLFPAHTGGPLSHRAERRAWFDGAAAAIGVEGLTPHELRHTAASLAVSVGSHVKVVQRMLGHASAAMTLDTYADLFDEDLDAVADRLDVVGRNALSAATEFRRNQASVTPLPINA